MKIALDPSMSRSRPLLELPALNPRGSTARVHQHLDIGQGEVDRDAFFGTLGRPGFGGREETIMTSCVVAWEERAHESSVLMRERIGASTQGRPQP